MSSVADVSDPEFVFFLLNLGLFKLTYCCCRLTVRIKIAPPMKINGI